MQRLFSMFPEGWPGAGLILLRAAAAFLLFQNGFSVLLLASAPVMVVLQSAIAGAAVLLLAGLFTPVAGSLLATAEVCLAFSHVKDPSVHVILGALGGGLAMTGPGAWSLDAHFFGRKRIQIPPR